MEQSNLSAKLKALLSIIRYKDIIIFQAPAIIGLMIYFPDVSGISWLRAILLGLGTFFLMAYIFVFNDWADISMDYRNAQKRQHTYRVKGLTDHDVLVLAVLLASAGTAILALISRMHVPLALLIVLFGLAYSYPVRGIKGKGIPIFSSFLHFATTLLTFLLGSMTYAPIDVTALLIGSYLGILITAGHLVQEVEDYDGDLLSNDKTNAVRFGQKFVFFIAFLIFGFSYIFIYWLTQIGLFHDFVKYTGFLYLVYAYLAFETYRAGLARERVRRLRSQYRMLFAVVVLVMVISALVNKWTW